MCDAIFHFKNGKHEEISNVWGLKRAGFVVTNEYRDESYNNIDLEKVDISTTTCLCPVDVEKLLKANGYVFSRDPFGWCLAPLKGVW